MGELIKRKRKQAFACFLFCLQGAFSAGNELTLRGFVQHGTLVHAKTAIEPHLADPAGGNKALIGGVIHVLILPGSGDTSRIIRIKYDNIRIGMNSRLDTIQAAVLQVKLKAFQEYELDAVNQVAAYYTDHLKGLVEVPVVEKGFYSSWAQYSILLKNTEERDSLQRYLKENGIPSMIYYPKSMHDQIAFQNYPSKVIETPNAEDLCNRVLALPIHPYLEKTDMDDIVEKIEKFLGRQF